jgi:hypothetical protein
MSTLQGILALVAAPNDGAPVGGLLELNFPVVDDMQAPPAYLRHGFTRTLSPDASVIQVICYWRHEVTGEVVWVPDPSWAPPQQESWVELGHSAAWDQVWATEVIRTGEKFAPDLTQPPTDPEPPSMDGADPRLSDPPADGGEPGSNEPSPGWEPAVKPLPDDNVPAYVRHGFTSNLPPEFAVIQVIVYWRHIATGEVVWAPDPSWGPPKFEGWEILDSPPPELDGRWPLPDDTEPAYVRHGFTSNLPPEFNVSQVIVYWRHIATGEVVWAPDPSWGPPQLEGWEHLGSSPAELDDRWPTVVEPPIETDPPIVTDPPIDPDLPPVEGRDPQPSDPTRRDGEPGVGGLPPPPPDLEVVVYHWKHRAVLEKSAWRVGEQVEALVGESLPRLFRPVFEEDPSGGRKLGLSALASDKSSSGAPDPVSDPAATTSADSTASDAAAVNLRDAVAILRMLAGSRPGAAQAQAPSPFESIAADFDGDGAVGLGDALGVLRHATGAGGPKPAWAFVDETDPALPGRAGLNPGRLPEEPTGPGALKGKVGLVGVLRGDIDGSWAPPQAAEQLGDAWFSDLAGRIGERHADAGVDSSRWGVYPG